MNGVDEGRDVRAMLDSVLGGDTGPLYSPEEVLRSARKATAQRRAVVASALSVGVVLAAGAGVFLNVNGPSTVESASGVVLPTTALAAEVLPSVSGLAAVTTPEQAAELTAKLVAANVIPSGFQLTEVVGAPAGPMEFYRFGDDSAHGYKATAVVTDAKGRATLAMFVQFATKRPECTAENNCVMGTPLHGAQPVEPTVRVVDGVELVMLRDPGPGPVSTLSVQARFADGMVVTASVRSEVDVMSGGAPITEGPTRDEVPFSEQQLIDMVLKPGFRP